MLDVELKFKIMNISHSKIIFKKQDNGKLT